MGNSHTKHTIMRSSSMMKSPSKVLKGSGGTPKLRGVTKSQTTSNIIDKLHTPDGMYEDKESIQTQTTKHFSCFNFSTCNAIKKENMKCECEQNLIHGNISEDEKRYSKRSERRKSFNSSLFYKVRQRIVSLNRRSTPPNFSQSIDEGLAEPVANSVGRSFTDYQISNVKTDETEGLLQEEHLLKRRKFTKPSKFTKSPALYDIKLYANEDPELGQKRISDLLEEKEDNDYDDYEYDSYENDELAPRQLDPDLENNFTYTNEHNRFKSPESLNTFTSSSPSYGNLQTACPLLQNNSNKIGETESLCFIDDGLSEYCGFSTVSSSKCSSRPSIIYSSFKCSLNNLNKLVIMNNDNQYLERTESTKFLNEVSRKLTTFARHSEKINQNGNSIHVDISRNYDEQFNDNISIFNHASFQKKAPLASSETTTLSNSNDNLLTNSYRLFGSKKYPTIAKVLLNHQQQYYDSDSNNNYF